MTDDSLWVDGPDGFEDIKPAPARKAKGKAKGDGRHIGCPLWWFKAVLPVVQSKNELVVALALWRLRSMRGRRTITVANVYLLAELGINRWTKYRALKRLAAAGIVTVKRDNKHALVVTFVRQKKGKRRYVRSTQQVDA
jgi:hypothetical protein